MQRSSIPKLLGYAGALFLFLGALVSFASGIIYGAISAHAGPVLEGTALAVVSGALGVLALFMTYYARGNTSERLVGGLALLVLGLVAGVVLGISVLSVVGALFCFFAGLVFLLEGALPSLRAVSNSLSN